LTTATSTRPTSRSPERATPLGRRPRAPLVVARAVAALFAVGAAVYVVAALGGDDDPQLIAVQDVPADVRAELDTTWTRFTDRFAGRLSCIPDVAVELVRDVNGGDARYVVGRTVIEIEIPTTPARFRESLAHELGHHVEHTCAEFAELRGVLHPRWGGPARPWARGAVWAETPSERWAEGVVLVVNGERVRHAREMPIDDETVALIAAWARDEPIGG
jgi:hypothetical protein